MTNTLEDLRRSIISASEAYYLGDPIISDEEFDQLLDQLKTQDPNDLILTTVGWGLRVPYGQKVPLPAPIQHSLPKEQAIDHAVVTRGEYTPKIDGMTCVVKYEKGRRHPSIATTRGDGVHGIEITPKLHHLKTSLTLSEAPEEDFTIRGELYISPSDFDDNLSDEYANPRNAVSGIINRKSFDLLEHVRFVQHGGESLHDIPYVPTKYATSTDDLKALHNWYVEWSREYPVDGLVLNGDLAIKFKTSEYLAEIDYIDWTMSPRRQLVPVAVFKEPVLMYGTEVRRATLLHAAYVRDQGLGPGALVYVTKFNEIIPGITRVVWRVTPELPSTWTIDGTEYPTQFEGVRLYVNGGHHEAYRSALVQFVREYFTTDGATDPYRIVDSLNIVSFAQLEQVTPEKVQDLQYTPQWGPSRTAKIAPLFDKSRTLDARYVFSSLGISGIGVTNSKKMAEHLLYVYSNDVDGFLSHQALAVNVREAVLTNWSIIRDVCVAFIDRLKVPEEKKVDTQACTVVLTGKFPVKKSLIEGALAKIGVEVSDYVAPHVTFVVQSDPNSNSNKSEQARAKGIPIISYHEMIERFSIRGLPT